MMFYKIAFKNIIRNRRRSLSTLLSFVFGITMMTFTNGFLDGFSDQWSDSIIDQYEGHLKVRHKDFVKFGITDKEKIVINDPQELISRIKKNPHVAEVMQRVLIAGLIGNDKSTTTFIALLDDVSKKDRVLPAHAKEVIQGKPLSAETKNGIVMGRGLAKSINAQIGDELVIVSNTVYGEQSAMLVNVIGLMTSEKDPKEEQRMAFGSLSREARENLLEIGDGTTELLVRLDKKSNVGEVVEWLNKDFQSKGESWNAVPWYSIDAYVKLMRLFRTIVVVIMIILTLIVCVVVNNSLMMSLFERTKEIGTMRAMGLQKSQVYQLFYSESLLITVVGAVLGIAMGALLISAGNHFGGISISDGFFQGVKPIMRMSNLLISFFVPVATAMLFAFLPIRSSCKMDIVETLNYN